MSGVATVGCSWQTHWRTDVQQQWGHPATHRKVSTHGRTGSLKSRSNKDPAVVDAEREAQNAREAGGQITMRQLVESQ